MTVTIAYLNEVLADLRQAIERRDGDAAVAVLQRIRAHGHTRLADLLLHELIVAGLRNFQAQLDKRA